MAYCNAKKKLVGGGVIGCDLDQGHEILIKLHHDKLNDLDWRDGLKPAAVPYTPTGPMPKLKEKV